MKAWYEANPAMLDSFEVGCSESHEKAFSLHKEDMSQQKWWPVNDEDGERLTRGGCVPVPLVNWGRRSDPCVGGETGEVMWGSVDVGWGVGRRR